MENLKHAKIRNSKIRQRSVLSLFDGLIYISSIYASIQSLLQRNRERKNSIEKFYSDFQFPALWTSCFVCKLKMYLKREREVNGRAQSLSNNNFRFIWKKTLWKQMNEWTFFKHHIFRDSVFISLSRAN